MNDLAWHTSANDRQAIAHDAARIGFSGLSFSFHGLTAVQQEQILKRYGAGGAPKPGAGHIPVELSCQPFKTSGAERYTGPYGYEPVLTHSEHAVMVEGLEFRGKVTLAPEIRGELVCNDNRQLVEPIVYENFLRIITAYAIALGQGLFMHSAAVLKDGLVYVFLGRSNAGKTTISRKALAGGAQVLSDDANVLFRSTDAGYSAGPVPFAGELGQTAARPGGPFPVAGIYWLEKADENRVYSMSQSQQIMRMMVCSPVLNVDPFRSDLLFDRLTDITNCLPLRCLRFSKTATFGQLMHIMEDNRVSH